MSESSFGIERSSFGFYLYIGIILPCVYNIAQGEGDCKMENCMKCTVKTCAKGRKGAKCTMMH